MDNAYQDPTAAIKYLDFLNSKNGQIQQDVLFNALVKALGKTGERHILDAACGPGWLSARLKSSGYNVEGCDGSKFLIDIAKVNHPGVHFSVADVQKPLPYKQNTFDVVILNMAGPDLEDLTKAFANLSALLKPSSKLLATIPNPKYTFPAAEWKRSLLDVLLGRKPKLKFTNTLVSGPIQREFGKNTTIASHFYHLSDYIAASLKAGFTLMQTIEIKSPKDSTEFDLTYQLYRHPLFLLLEFQKT